MVGSKHHLLLIQSVLLQLTALSVYGEGFVEEVSCASDHMTVVINRSDSDVRSWLSNPESQPIVYVYGFKNRTPCGISIKLPGPGVEHHSMNFTVVYGPSCNVFLVDVEPNFLTAETTVAIEDNSQHEYSKPMRINHVFCLYTSQVQALKINDVTNGHQVVASTGGKPKPKVQMLFRNPDGTPLKSAKFGDQVSMYLMLSPDNAYKAISPKHCMFSDRDDMKEAGARTLTFVQSNCPVPELKEIIQPLQDINEEMYYTQFQAFRFGQQSTVYAHCTVEVCLDTEKCEKQCYQRVLNASLLEQKRFQRNSGFMSIDNNSSSSRGEHVSISSQFVVLDENNLPSSSSSSTEAAQQKKEVAAASAAANEQEKVPPKSVADLPKDGSSGGNCGTSSPPAVALSVFSVAVALGSLLFIAVAIIMCLARQLYIKGQMPTSTSVHPFPFPVSTGFGSHGTMTLGRGNMSTLGTSSTESPASIDLWNPNETTTHTIPRIWT